MLGSDRGEYANEALEHLGERDELWVARLVVRLGRAGDVLDQAGEELPDAELHDTRPTRGSGQERRQAVQRRRGRLINAAQLKDLKDRKRRRTSLESASAV